MTIGLAAPNLQVRPSFRRGGTPSAPGQSAAPPAPSPPAPAFAGPAEASCSCPCPWRLSVLLDLAGVEGVLEERDEVFLGLGDLLLGGLRVLADGEGNR